MNQFTASLWGDEGFSAILSMKSIPEIISIISRDTSPPLYNITEHIAFQLFGVSEVVIRSLSFFYYVLAIFFIYKIASFIWDRKTGLIASILSFLNPFFFIYAFEGRMYSIMALGVTSSMYFFLKILYFKKSKKVKFPKYAILGYIIATNWALYSHHFAFFAVFVQGIIFLMEILKRNFKTTPFLFIGFVLAGIGYIPWLMPLYNQTKMVSGGFWLGTPSLTDLKKLIYEYLAVGINNPLSNFALYLVFIIITLRKWTQEKYKSLVFLLWFSVPIIATWTISQYFQSIFYNRYLLYTIPGAMFILASQRRKIVSSILIAILIGFFIQIDYQYFTHPTKRPFRELAEYVKENKRGDDFLINWNAGSHHLWETKFYGIPAPIYIPEKAGELPFFVGTALMEDSDFVKSIPKGTYRVVVITSGNVDDVSIPTYTKKEEIKKFGDLSVIWLRK